MALVVLIEKQILCDGEFCDPGCVHFDREDNYDPPFCTLFVENQKVAIIGRFPRVDACLKAQKRAENESNNSIRKELIG
jgi:hypothetical protein